jgi:hypothetical protein
MEPRLVNDEFLPEHYRFISQDKTRRIEGTVVFEVI